MGATAPAIIHLLIIVAASYIIGSFPTSIVVGKLFFHTDIRKLGSGNAGGTNTFRAFGWKAGVPVILFDVAKGVVATLVISRVPAFSGTTPLLSTDALRLVAGGAAVIGHIWTVFAGFRGGKGVGTAAGMMLSLFPLGLAIAALVFALVIVSTGIVSVGSIVAAVSFPIVVAILSITGVGQVSPLLLAVAIVAALLIIFTHRSNLRRLFSGTENRFERLMIFRNALRAIRGTRKNTPEVDAARDASVDPSVDK